MASSRVKMKVGLRLGLTVFWAFVLVAGLTIALVLAAPGLASAISGALTGTLTSSGIAAALAVGMILVGLWGIASSYRNMKHSLDLMAEADRARKETLQHESSRYLQEPKP